MSKLFEAMEKAKREQGLREDPDLAPGVIETPSSPTVPRSAAPPVLSGEPREDAFGAAQVKKPARRSHLFQPEEHLVSLVAPRSFEAEQYRALRTTVEQQHREKGLCLVAVTSPGVGDGKTTTAINLAGALAQDADAHVLLMGVDLRQPALGQYLGMGESDDRGLIQLVRDPRLSLADVVAFGREFNLSVLPAGGYSDAPYELLKSSRFQEILEEARLLYDYVVLDAPPLLGCPDCRLIGRFVDGFLIVVAADKTPRRQVEETLDNTVPDKLIGVVFNGDSNVSKYSSAYYSSGGGAHRGSKRRFTR